MNKIYEKLKVKIEAIIDQLILSAARYSSTHVLLQRLAGSYSQYGEDLIVHALLAYKSSGTYVDIGANDPNIMSSTKRFYNYGWSGLNIEPDPVNFEKLLRSRPRDINLNVGIACTEGKLTFYRMSASTLSTFSELESLRLQKEGYRVLSNIEVNVLPLLKVLEQYKIDEPIDFMNIDVEGFEIEVLMSNDFERFRPTVMMVEVNRNPDEILKYLRKKSYLPIYNNLTNCIFVNQIAFDINEK